MTRRKGENWARWRWREPRSHHRGAPHRLPPAPAPLPAPRAFCAPSPTCLPPSSSSLSWSSWSLLTPRRQCLNVRSPDRYSLPPPVLASSMMPALDSLSFPKQQMMSTASPLRVVLTYPRTHVTSVTFCCSKGARDPRHWNPALVSNYAARHPTPLCITATQIDERKGQMAWLHSLLIVWTTCCASCHSLRFIARQTDDPHVMSQELR